ncbi:preprotein translocase subunit SecG [Candidatus Microgenomates bacterium]|nr:preprotein translocase subunit SecG [Candidatus Microgenomates bacterium]
MILTAFQIILGILLIVLILSQGKGGLLSKRWAGDNFRSKKGVEKVLFFLTIFLGIAFIVSSILVVITT